MGNKVAEINPERNITSYSYDDLYRLEEIIYPDGSSRDYFYDNVGNKIKELNGRSKTTVYEYNSLNQLVKIEDAAGGITTYSYDPEGNLLVKELPNGLNTVYEYNRLNQLTKEIRPEGGVINYNYDSLGNLREKIDRKGQQTNYTYRRDYLPVKIEYRDNEGNIADTINYSYDKEERRLTAEDNDSLIEQVYDPLGRITKEERIIAEKTYTTQYSYDKIGNLTSIKYPESDQWLDYSYNNLNQLVGIEGIADGTVSNPAFTYNNNGFLTNVKYNNGTNTVITADINSRIEGIQIEAKEEGINKKVLDISYAYDRNNNVKSRENKITGNTNHYYYDNLDRLKTADVEGTFYGERTGFPAVAEEDFFGNLGLVEKDNYQVKLDYKANSVGIILVEQTVIGKIELEPEAGISVHRLKKETLSIHYSFDNFSFNKVPEDMWYFIKDDEGKVTIIFEEPVIGLAFKIHSKFDDRDQYFSYVDRSSFINDISAMVKIYQRADKAKLEYDYDSAGNRRAKRVVTGNIETTTYEYYEDSNRLKKTINNLTGETIYYLYDENGNLIEKGNEAIVDAEGNLSIVKDTVTSRYWKYGYSTDNRLTRVYYKGKLKAEYTYDADGKRILSATDEGTTSFVFNYAGKVLFEDITTADSSTTVEQTSYIYAHTRQIARVEGVIGGNGEVIYYHHDNLGSTRLMTNSTGEIVWEQDYMPFGEDLHKPGTSVVSFGVEAEYKFTGQREEDSIGLYYYGARYYDPAIGRFITEDSYRGEINSPQSQNLYVYVMNNPLRYVDPSGNIAEEENDFNIFNIFDIFNYFLDLLTSDHTTIMEVESIETVIANNLDMEQNIDTGFSNESTFNIVPETGIVLDNYTMNKLHKSNENFKKNILQVLNNTIKSDEFQLVLKNMPRNNKFHVMGVGVGIGQTLGYWPVGGQGSGLIVFDDRGNIGIYTDLEAGAYIGFGGSGGIRGLISEADTIYDIVGTKAISVGGEIGPGFTTVGMEGCWSLDGESSIFTFGVNKAEYLSGVNFNLAFNVMYNPSWLIWSTNSIVFQIVLRDYLIL